jgi:hypothetical protein
MQWTASQFGLGLTAPTRIAPRATLSSRLGNRGYSSFNVLAGPIQAQPVSIGSKLILAARHWRTASMICENGEITKGIRVKLSPLGAARCPRLADKEGVIVGAGQYQSTVRIIFDGLKSPTSLHRDYVEPICG